MQANIPVCPLVCLEILLPSEFTTKESTDLCSTRSMRHLVTRDESNE